MELEEAPNHQIIEGGGGEGEGSKEGDLRAVKCVIFKWVSGAPPLSLPSGRLRSPCCRKILLAVRTPRRARAELPSPLPPQWGRRRWVRGTGFCGSKWFETTTQTPIASIGRAPA